ncbi:dihydrofolate reductase [Pseudonocardiaceae bacterium YIM PH 21723]|nr:dihydrofolate reductase [Pseudonocardiaceae bacterium YIM PH 21723]
MTIGLIWAQNPQGVIGARNTIPWRLPEDMAHFKATTLGHPVVMGRKTWDSLPPRFRPLAGRRNIVVTRDRDWAAEGADSAGSVTEALELAGRDSATVWVIGGGEIYRAAMDHATLLSVTDVQVEVQGEAFAPTITPDWTVTQDSDWQTSTSGLRYRIRAYQR